MPITTAHRLFDTVPLSKFEFQQFTNELNYDKHVCVITQEILKRTMEKSKENVHIIAESNINITRNLVGQSELS